ncbi:M23 family metallopeptidase [bacterium]|nr:M23 family metallopeptidase [bacterium]
MSLFLQDAPRKKTNYSFILLPLLVVALLGGLIYLLTRFDLLGSKPVITLVNSHTQELVEAISPLSVGKNPAFVINLTNKKNKICSLDVSMTQNGATKNVFHADKTVGASETTPITVPLSSISLPQLGFTEGDGGLVVEAEDCSLFGSTGLYSQPIKIDFSPPILGLTSTQHYVNQAGADLVTYRISGDVSSSGVRIGPYQFKGFKIPGSRGQSGEYFTMFVYSYDLKPGEKIEVYARDEAGNEAITTLVPAKFFAKEFRTRDIEINDDFINNQVAAIISSTPGLTRTGDNLKDFLLVNNELRKKNAAMLLEFGKKSEEKFYWKDAFIPLQNAAIMANFADYRNYMYNGQNVDKQVHLGFDMAATEHYPISANNRGKVLFAGYLGIYGNTVIIDHGYGLETLYGHLSSIGVAVGDIVEKGAIIGNSGATGLAGGDHLHFSMLIQGVQVNPIEMWDPHWIEDHIYLRLGKELFN